MCVCIKTDWSTSCCSTAGISGEEREKRWTVLIWPYRTCVALIASKLLWTYLTLHPPPHTHTPPTPKFSTRAETWGCLWIFSLGFHTQTCQSWDLQAQLAQILPVSFNPIWVSSSSSPSGYFKRICLTAYTAARVCSRVLFGCINRCSVLNK